MAHPDDPFPDHGYDRAGYDPARDADEEWARREADAGPARCVCCYERVTVGVPCANCAACADDRRVFTPCRTCRACALHCLCQPEEPLSREDDLDDTTGED